MQTNVLAIISDGYTESGTIAGVPGMYPPVTFTFRPMLQEQLTAYYKASDKASSWQTRQIVAKLLADHLVSWDVKDGREQIVPIKVPQLLRLKDRLFGRLFGVVSTQEAPDAQPDQPDDDLETAAADLLRAASADAPLAQAREEAARKN